MKNKKYSSDNEFDTMLKAAAEKANCDMGAEAEEFSDIEFSKEHIEKMNKIFDKEKSANKKYGMIYLERIACILIIAVFVSSISFYGVNSLRIDKVKFAPKIDGKESYIYFNDSRHYHDTYFSIHKLPSEFDIDYMDHEGPVKRVRFRNGDKYLMFAKYPESGDYLPDYTNTKPIRKKKFKGRYGKEEDGSIKIIFDTEFATYSVVGNLEKNEMIDVAASVMY